MLGSLVIVITLLFLSYTVFAGTGGIIAELQAIRLKLEKNNPN